jgi:multidrug transporter EmrE-like cation transporter
MGSKLLTLFMLLLASAAFPFAAEGGNVTHMEISLGQNLTDIWSGITGERNFSGLFSQELNASPGGIAGMNVTFPSPNCSYSSISLYVVLSLNGSVTLPLSAGNLGQLDAYANDPLHNASATFTRRGSLTLSSGTYLNVPYTRTCGSDCGTQVFPTYYLQDSAGRFVFVGAVMPGSPGVFGPADYQMIVPTNGSNATYAMATDINYTCISNVPNATVIPPSPSSHVPPPTHGLYISPIESATAMIGDSITVTIVVENAGETTENNIDVYVDGRLFSGHFAIPFLYVGDSLAGDLIVTPYEIGNLSVSAVARNGDASANRMFSIVVLPQCTSDPNCTSAQYCSGYRCENRLPDGSSCTVSDQCLSNLCANGMCGGCRRDDECSQSQLCIAGNCVEVPGGKCGTFSNHMFTPYQCCADADCGTLQQCSNNACVESDFTIIQDTVPTENELAAITIVDRNGRPLANLGIVGGGTTDKSGRATITAPHDKNVCVRFGTETRCKKISVNLIGEIYAEGLPIEGRQLTVFVRDVTGTPVSFVDISVGGNPVGKTDENGRIVVSMPHSGEVGISGEKLGYVIRKYTASVVGRDRVCDLPFRAYPAMPVLDTSYPLLAAASIVFMALSFAIMRKMKKGVPASLAYALLPAVAVLLGEAACGIFSSSLMLLAVAAAALEYMALSHVAKGGMGSRK